jgi:hypothetical protein
MGPKCVCTLTSLRLTRNGENPQLVTDLPVDFKKQLVRFKTSGNLPSFKRSLWNIPKFSEGNPKDHSM